MKTLLVFALILLLCSIGIQAQKEDHKNPMNAFPGPLGLENMHGLSSKGNRYETRLPGLPRIPERNHHKSALELTQVLDSTIYEDWDSAVHISDKVVYAYDANDNNTSQFHFGFNNPTSQWGQFMGEGFSYDAGGNLTSDSVYYNYGDTSQWYNYFKIDYTYNDAGNMTQDMMSLWDYRNYSNAQWAVFSKDEYTYDANRNVSFYVSGYWFENSIGEWVDHTKTEFTYDVGGNLTGMIDYLPNRNSDQWFSYKKEEYAYDDSEFENLIKVNYFDWDNVTSKWIYSGWDDITYDSNGNITLIMTYKYDANLDQSVNYTKTEITHDSYNIVTTVVSYWNSTTGKWIMYSKKTDYYSQHDITGVPAIPGRTISVYPNPASGYVIFEGLNGTGSAKIELFDLEGKKVLEQKLPENRQINVSNLDKGQYLYRLQDNGKKYSGKIIVE